MEIKYIIRKTSYKNRFFPILYIFYFNKNNYDYITNFQYIYVYKIIFNSKEKKNIKK